MKKYQYHAIHIAISAVYGKPSKCELCKGKNNSKRFEWSNKDHKYTLNIEDWWQLCATCHRRYDNAKFGKVAWNKGNRKERPTKICEYCKKPFTQKRKEQFLCSTVCAGRKNGNITKKKFIGE